jgi:hypothetical protein
MNSASRISKVQVKHIVSSCSVLAQAEYKYEHDAQNTTLPFSNKLQTNRESRTVLAA